MKEKRKARKEVSEQLDLLFPIPLEKFGSEEDPCFGKLYNPLAPECMVCGDAEICQLLTAQRLHAQRKGEEENGHFKDMEERDIYKSKDPTKEDILKLKNRIRKTVKRKGKIKVSILIKRMIRLYPVFDEEEILTYIEVIAGKSKKVTLKKKNLIWKGASSKN